MRGGPAHTYTHTHTHTREHTPPTRQTPPDHTAPRGLQGAPPTHQVRGGPRDPLWVHRAAQSCLGSAALPKPLSFAVPMCPPHWAGAWKLPGWGHPSIGHPLPPYRAAALSSALPSIPRSWGVGAAQPDGLQDIRSWGQLFWPCTKVTEREVTAQQCLLLYFNMKRENFQPSSGQGGAATISQASVWSKDQMHCWGNV